MIKIIGIIVLICLSIISCSRQTHVSEDIPLNSTRDEFKLEEKMGTYVTTLKETSHYGEFLTNEQVKNVLTAPKISVNGTEICVLREFADEALTGNVDDFQNYNAAPTDLNDIKYAEIYKESSFDSNPVVILLEGTDGVRLRPVAVYYDVHTGKFSFIHRILTDGMLTYQLWVFKGNGDLESNEMLSLPVSEYLMFGIYLTENAVYYMPDNGKDSYYHTLYRYDIESGEITEAAEDVRLAVKQEESIYFISKSLDGSFESANTLFSLNLRTGEISEVIPVDWPSGEDISDMAFDIDNRIVYYGGISTIFAYLHEAGEIVEVLQGVDENVAVIGMCANNVLIRVGNNMIAAYESTADLYSIDEVRIPIKVCIISNLSSAEEMFSRALELCRANGYNFKAIDMIQTSSPDEYAETVAKKILAGDSDFDIFMIDDETQILLERRYYENLSQYELLNTYFDKMLPGVRQLCSVGDDLCLIPRTLLGTVARYDTSYILGEAAVPNNCGEINTLKTKLTLKDNSLSVDFSEMSELNYALFETLISNFMNEVINDKDTERDLILLYQLITEEKLTQSKFIDIDSANFYMGCESIYYPGKISDNDILIYPLPKMDATYKNSINGTYYAINPNSQSKENAAILLAAMMQCTMNSPFGYFYENYDGADDGGTYRQIIADSIRTWKIPNLKAHLEEQMELILSGIQSTQESAANTFKYIKMIRDE